jgi:hypothetical protein
VEHLKGNIEALGLQLNEEELDKIDNAYGFEMGFPHDFINPANKSVLGPEDDLYRDPSPFRRTRVRWTSCSKS